MFLYKIKNNINEKVYIGQTTSSLSIRWKRHCVSKSCPLMSKAIEKYGEENFTIEEIGGANSLSELNYLEWLYIHKFNSMALTVIIYKQVEETLEERKRIRKDSLK